MGTRQAVHSALTGRSQARPILALRGQSTLHEEVPMKRFSLGAAAWAAALALLAAPALAADPLNLTLNWTPGGDHSPFFYAEKMGWYKEAGIDLTVEFGKGSAFAVQKVGSGASPMGVADMTTVLQGRGKGADVVGVMAIYANSPFGFYWKKSSGIATVADFKGKRIGNPPADAARQMWPLLAKVMGLQPGDVTWVNIAPQAKVPSVQANTIDVTTDFYNFHYGYQRTFGADLGFYAPRDHGFNPYGNAIVVNGAYLKSHRAVVERFVRVSQRAFAQCVKDEDPCIQELARVASQDVADVKGNWDLVQELMSNETTRTVALGYLDPKRMENDYESVKAVFEITPFDVKSAYSNDFLDRAIKMPK
jgi:NitT/TauT family transport system substrate-binding protein